MNAEGLEDYLADRRLAIGALLDRMVVGDLARVCSRRGITEAEVAAAVRRHAILRLSERVNEKGEA
jgi:hypothetical protein